MYRIRYTKNWGTRLLREYIDFYTTVKPTIEEIIDILNTNGIPAETSWLKPENSGLITTCEIVFEF